MKKADALYLQHVLQSAEANLNAVDTHLDKVTWPQGTESIMKAMWALQLAVQQTLNCVNALLADVK